MAVRTITDEEVLAKFPGIAIDHDNKEHYRGILEKRLLLNRCSDCGHWQHTPRDLCPKCWSRNVVPTEISGRGVVYSYSLLHMGPSYLTDDYAEPFPIVMLEIPEQPHLRISPRIVRCKPEELRIGMPMELVWIERDGIPVPAFQPSKK